MDGDQYGSLLAADYHWYFDDVDRFLGCDTPGVRAAIAALRPGARVLDAACGIGIDAVALQRRGFDVAASDASVAMVALARARLADAGAGELVVAAAWTELPATFEHRSFDAVFCVGNSIPHAPDAASMVAAFEAFRAVLAPGGVLVVDTQDWELLHTTGSEVSIEPNVVERDGVRCVRTYSWHVPDSFDGRWTLDIAPIFLEGDRATLRRHTVRMWPFTRRELKRRLAAAGFVSIALDAIPGDDRYTAVARRPDTS